MHPGAAQFFVGVLAALLIASPASAQAAAGPERGAAIEDLAGPPIPLEADLAPSLPAGAEFVSESAIESEPDSDADAPAPLEAAPPTVVQGAESLPLGRSPDSSAPSDDGSLGFADSFAGNWVGRTILALALVIGLAVLLRAGMRRVASGGGLVNQLGAGGRAPSGLLSVLGRYPVARGQSLVLLKVDRRVLLLCQTSAGFQTLSEIVDPEEVASILVTARDEDGTSTAARFSSVLQDLERDPRIAGVAPAGQSGAGWGPTTPRGRSLRMGGDDGSDPVAQLRRRLASLSEQAG